jgi:hypothetical protein
MEKHAGGMLVCQLPRPQAPRAEVPAATALMAEAPVLLVRPDTSSPTPMPTGVALAISSTCSHSVEQ